MSAIAPPDRAYAKVVSLTGALFLSYLCVAMALPAVPIVVVQGMGLSNVWGGFAVGIAFLSTILTRARAGASADRIGGKICMERGLLVYAAAGAAGWLAVLPGLPVAVALPALIFAWLLLGLGESLAMVGMVAWAIGLLGPARSGQVLALVGMGLYGAFAVGGPLGVALLQALGAPALMAACTVAPLLGLIGVRRIAGVAPQAGPREPLRRILGRIWVEGGAVFLQGVGFAGLGAFFTLYFLSRGWPYAGLGLSCFGGGFVAVRLFCGHLPDRLGGTRVAIASLGVEAVGQFLLWLAPGPIPALVGALLTGCGCSMVFPSLGSEVVKRTPPQLRGVTVGSFAAFQDLAYGLTGPLAGGLADRFGYPVVFLVGGVAAILGLAAATQTGRLRRPNS